MLIRGYKMREILPFLIVGILVLSGLGAVTVSSEESEQKKAILSFSNLSIQEKDEYVTLELEGADSQLVKKDHYIVPTRIETFTFPFGTEILSIRCTPENIHKQELNKEIIIAPEPILTDQTIVNKNTQKSENPLTVNTWYDYSIGCGINGKQRNIIVKVQVFPVQYYPEDNSIDWAEKVEIEINYKEPEPSIMTFDDEYDFIVLTPSEFTGELNSLVSHKEGRGISTKLVTLNDIYGGSYFPVTGRDDPEKIKYFIKNAIENWNTQYVLLVGGFDDFPTRETHVYVDYGDGDDEVFVSDLYYADIYGDGGVFSSWDTNDNDVFGEYDWGSSHLNDDVDLYPDVYLSRLACTSGNEVTTCVNKIISYEDEVNPAYTQNWFTKIVVIGGDTSPNDDEDVDEGEYTNQAILDIMDGFIPDKIWDSNKRLSGISPTGMTNINNGINSGCGFVDWSGHGAPTVWTTYPHNGDKQTLPTPTRRYYSSDIMKLTNGDMLPIVVTGACSPSKFSASDNTFSWSYLSNPNGGGIGSFGPAALSWGYTTSYCIKALGGKMQLELFKAYKEHGAITFGGMWTKAISNYIHGSMDCGDYKTVEEWQPFGDPTLVIAEESLPPVKPDAPDGPVSGSTGTSYTYSASTTDPDGDQISYLFDWDDGSYSEWTALKNSGQTATASHTWTSSDTFQIRVKAKDEHGVQSDWSPSLPISMPRTRQINNPLLIQILERLADIFPILWNLLQLQ